jgi:uncharacterized protein
MADENLKNRIEELKEELKNTKVNKKTEGSVGKLKAKIAKHEEELEQRIQRGKGKRGEGYSVRKEGDATIGLLGKPSVGKSTILSKLTNKKSKIGAYEFTTLDVVPGLLHHKFTNLQILDLPGIIDRASDNRGFGKKVLSVVRACDLVVFVIDAVCPFKDMEMILNETSNSRIRINKKKPFIEVIKKEKGGVVVPINKSSNKISYEIIKQIMNDNKIINGEVLIHEEGLNIDDLLDSVYKSVEYKKGIICINKIDLISKNKLEKQILELKKTYPSFKIFKVSAHKNLFLNEFKDFLWENLGFIWVYLKEQKKQTDFSKPLLLKKRATIRDVCQKIHNSFVDRFKFAKVKGISVKFEWQRVGIEHRIEDKDEIELILN